MRYPPKTPVGKDHRNPHGLRRTRGYSILPSLNFLQRQNVREKKLWLGTSNIGFEKQIWDAACVLRGNIDASEYKSVVLGLIFLKYISDRFEAKYKELHEEGDGFEEDQDEYTAENIFFVPENARWSAIAAAAHTPEIGTVIDDYQR